MATLLSLNGATSSLLHVLLLLLLLHKTTTDVSAADDTSCLSQHALDTGRQLAERFEPHGQLSRLDFGRLLADLASSLNSHSLDHLGQFCVKTGVGGDEDDAEVNCTQLLVQCPTIDVIFRRHSRDNVTLTSVHLSAALQEAVFAVTNRDCYTGELSEHGRSRKPTTAQGWGYSLGFVTLIVIISNMGGFLAPLMAKSFFQKLLQFLVAMGSGTLCATGLLVLIPEAFDIVSDEKLAADYIWKSATAMFAIYVFFIMERLLKFLLGSKELKREDFENVTMIVKPPSHGHLDVTKTNDVNMENGDGIRETDILDDSISSDHGHSHFVAPSHGTKKRGEVATVAWIVMVGDGIHKFVDGIAVGAAYTENVYLGTSIGIAILCEELAHELGDIAILLHSGMTMKKALLVNLLAASFCYVGLICGVVLGENTEANRWILAMAGGLFLYVPLVDMLPDMSHHLDQKLREIPRDKANRGVSGEVWGLLLMQAMGLLTGMCIILIVANFAGDIDVA